MTADDATIQAATRAVGRAASHWRDTNGFTDVPDCVLAKAAIAAYLDGLEKAGWKVVPKEPTHEMERAAACSKAKDDEGEFVSLSDHIDYSGENKTRTVIRQALRDAVAASPTPPGAE